MGEFLTNVLMKTAQSAEDGSLGILTCIASPNVKSGQFFGPGMGGMITSIKGPAKGYALEETYDNPETKDLLWSLSCDAIEDEFII